MLDRDVILEIFDSSELKFDGLGTTNYVPSTSKRGRDKEEDKMRTELR